MKSQPMSSNSQRHPASLSKLVAPPLLKIKETPHKPEDQQLRQTPHFIYHQPSTQSPRKHTKNKKITSLNHHSVVSVTQIHLQENPQITTQNSEMEPRIINFPNRDTKNRPTLNQYLSVTSFPDELQYRPSKISISKLQKQNHYNQDFSNGIDKCQECEYEGEMEKIYKLGWVAWSWIVFFVLVSVLLFFVPLVIKSFQQKELICPECGSKVRVESPTCL